MLKSFTIKNFKSFKDATLELSPFTLMIGANASGKSNALEALQVVKWLINPTAQENIDNINALYLRDAKRVLFDKKIEDFEASWHFSENSQEFISSSSEFIKNYPHKKYNSFEDTCLEILKTPMVLDLYPHETREYSLKMFTVMQPKGEFFSSCLYNLCQNPAHKELLLTSVQSLPEQTITDIKFIDVKERQEVMLILEERFGDKKQEYDVKALSDGTLRVLAIVAFVLSAHEGQILLIEEVDNGIHPSRIKGFMQKIRDIATKRKLQVIMTSHNPALLDAVPNENLADVVCCYRDKDEGDSRFVRLGDLYLYPELIAQGSLGDLVTQGIVDKFVHDKRTEEEIVQDRLNWLEDFQRRQKEMYDEEK